MRRRFQFLMDFIISLEFSFRGLQLLRSRILKRRREARKKFYDIFRDIPT